MDILRQTAPITNAYNAVDTMSIESMYKVFRSAKMHFFFLMGDKFTVKLNCFRILAVLIIKILIEFFCVLSSITILYFVSCD